MTLRWFNDSQLLLYSTSTLMCLMKTSFCHHCLWC